MMNSWTFLVLCIVKRNFHFSPTEQNCDVIKGNGLPTRIFSTSRSVFISTLKSIIREREGITFSSNFNKTCLVNCCNSHRNDGQLLRSSSKFGDWHSDIERARWNKTITKIKVMATLLKGRSVREGQKGYKKQKMERRRKNLQQFKRQYLSIFGTCLPVCNLMTRSLKPKFSGKSSLWN